MMTEIGSRIECIRKSEGLTRAEFGIKLGKTKDAIYNAEKNRARISDELIQLICSQFYIRESWLREGEGDMYSNPHANMLAKIITEIEDNDNLYNLTKELLTLTDEEIDVLQKLISVFKKSEGK